MELSALLGCCLGIGLAAACGFRVFVPMLVLSLAARADAIALGPQFGWMMSDAAMYAFVAATVVEVGSFYVPWIDNALDVISAPLASLAGVVIFAAVFTDVPPVVRWSAAIIAGGGTAGGVAVATGLTRAASTMTTGGLGNWVVSTLEWILALIVSLVTIVLPVLGVLMLVLAVVFIVRSVQRWRRRKAEAA